MTWTDERIELLKKLWADGLSASQIAAELGGVTRNAVIGKVHRLGLSGRVKSAGSAAPRPRKPVIRPASSSSSSRPSSTSSPGSFSVRGNVALKPVIVAETNAVAMVEQEAEDVVVAMSRRVSIMELREGVCKWPLGDPMTADFVYCGADCTVGTVYCSCHSRMAYQPTQDRRRGPEVRR